MSKPTKTIIAIGALFVAASMAQAQPAPEWNRKVEAIAVLPSAAAGDSFFDIFAVISVSANGILTTSDLSMEMDVVINGTTTQTQTVIASAEDPTPVDSCDGLCGNRNCVCVNVGDSQVCGCNIVIIKVPADEPEPGAPGDEIMVLLRPAPGALPENDQSDDFIMQSFGGDPIFWNRRITSVEVTPVAGAGDSFFDIFTVITYEGNYGGALPLDAALDVEINGVLLNSLSVDFGGTSIWTNCPVICGTTCATNPTGGALGLCVEEKSLLSCLCSSFPLDFTIPAVPLTPGDDIRVILRPAPGALPELPGFEEDEEVLPVCPWDCADFNFIVDVVDFFELIAHWGPCFPQ
jgi:hypothetical protein